MPNIQEYCQPKERVKRMSAGQVARQIELRKKFHLPPDSWWDEEKERYVIPGETPSEHP